MEHWRQRMMIRNCDIYQFLTGLSNDSRFELLCAMGGIHDPDLNIAMNFENRSLKDSSFFFFFFACIVLQNTLFPLGK